MDELITKPFKRLIETSKNYAKHQIGELYGYNNREDTLILSDMKILRSEKIKYCKNINNKNLDKSTESTKIILNESNFYNEDMSDFSINKSFTPPKTKPELVTVKLFPSPKKSKISYVEIENNDTKENISYISDKISEKQKTIAIELNEKHFCEKNEIVEVPKKKVINIKFTVTKTKCFKENDRKKEYGQDFIEYVQNNDHFHHENCAHRLNEAQNYSNDTSNLLQRIDDYFKDYSEKEILTTDLDNLDNLNEIKVPSKTISEISFPIQTTDLDNLSLRSVEIPVDLKCPNNSQTEVEFPNDNTSNVLQIIEDYFSKYSNKSVQTTDLDEIFAETPTGSIPGTPNGCIFEDNQKRPLSPIESFGNSKDIHLNVTNPLHSTQHDFSTMANETGRSSIIFGASRNQALSPIPNESPFPKVRDLISYHEKVAGVSPDVNRRHSLPIMGRARLMEKVECTDQSKLNDSEIIHKLVHDRFIVNSYKNRSFKKPPKKPARFGKIYRSLENRLRAHDERLSKTFHAGIVPLESSSPIKLDFAFKLPVSSGNHDYSRISEEDNEKLTDNFRDEDKNSTDGTVDASENQIEYCQNETGHPQELPSENYSINDKKDVVPKEYPKFTSNYSWKINRTDSPVLGTQVPNKLDHYRPESSNKNSSLENVNRYSTSTVFEEMPQNQSYSVFDSEYASASQFSENYYNSTDDFSSFSDYLTAANTFKNYDSSNLVSNEKLAVSKVKGENEDVEKSQDNTLGNELTYDMDEFLKKALGDELEESSSLAGQDEKREPEPLNEDSVCTSDASDLISKVNTFRSSIYKSLTRRLKKKAHENMHSTTKIKEEIKNEDDDYSSFPNTPEAEELMRQASLQYEAMQQLSKALTLCKNTKEFSSSEEQIEAERLLLLAKTRRAALYAELRNLDYERNNRAQSLVTGSLVISDITFPLKRILDKNYNKHHDQWFVCLITNGPTVISTRCVLARNLSYVEFEEEITCSDLQTNFELTIEVYSLLQKKSARNFSHESKFHLNKELKHSTCPVPKNIMHKEKSLSKTLSRANTGIHASSFRLNGSLKLRVTDITKKDQFKLQKVPLSSSLQGYISFRLQSQVTILITHSGFLTVGAIEQDHFIWNRRWCLLNGNMMYFWNYPCNIEDAIDPLETIDLRRCMNDEIHSADREMCSRPRTIFLETIETDSENLVKHFFNFDNWSEMKEWQRSLNEIVSILRSWNDSYLR